jgi:putative ABC transport system permease protein
MIKFLFKGLIRDRQRSFFPILIIIIGVMLTVVLNCWIKGIMGDMIDFSAKFSTGHVKIMSRAYAENSDQMPNDVALMGIDELKLNLQREYPDMIWVNRIRFGGLLDVPDDSNETKAQGPTIGLGVDLLSEESSEIDRLNIQKSLQRGNLPAKRGEILISEEFAKNLDVNVGETVTLISSTMFGSMTLYNFTISGTLVFGINAMDRSAIIVDIKDVQSVLDMEDAAGEILGYFNNTIYNNIQANMLTQKFNAQYKENEDKFAPVMVTLEQQNDLAGIIDYVSKMSSYFVFVFVLIMSIVLWNAGLIGGLRRYGEVGLRLAIGENKSGVYRSMIYESVLIGIIGSSFGTIVGLGISFWLAQGIDVGEFMKNSTMMFPNVYRANITPSAYYIGFIPGLFSTILGTVLSGIGIYKRKTAQLFKELEV